MQCLNWTALAAVVAAGATVWYAILTRRLWREAQRQTEGQIAPVLELIFDGVAGHTATLENIGKGVAVKGRLTVTSEPSPRLFNQFPGNGEPPGKYAEPLPLLKPGQIHEVDLNRASLLGGKGTDSPLMNMYDFHFRLDYESVAGTKHFSEFHALEGRIDPDRTRYGWNARGRAPGR